MQVDIGEDRRNHRSLAGSPVINRHDPVFEDARPQPFLDQADDALVANPVFQEADDRYSKASAISLPPRLLRLLPAGANRRVGLAPTYLGHWCQAEIFSIADCIFAEVVTAPA
jgi:hypothetical protein